MAKRDVIAPPRREADATVWLVFGSDEYRVNRLARTLVEQYCPPESRDLGVEVFDGRSENADAAVAVLRSIEEAVETLPLFGGAKLVWLKDANFLYDSLVGRTAAAKEALARAAARIRAGFPPGHRLLITAPKVDRRSAFFKACQTQGEVREFDIPEKPWEQEKYAAEFLRELLTENGLEASADVVAALYGKIGCDTRRLAIEVEKIKTFAGDRTRVTEEDVRFIVSPGRESAAWDLADAFGDRQAGRALAILRQLLFQGEKEFVLIMGLQSRARELALFRACIDRGVIHVGDDARWPKIEWRLDPEAERVLSDLPESLNPTRWHPFRAARLASQARRYSRAELAKAQRILLETHEAMVRSSAAPNVLLEIALIRIIGGSNA